MHFFLCYTPLHVLVAKRIIETEHIFNYYFIYICTVDNYKSRYYYGLLAKGAKQARYVYNKKAKLSALLNTLRHAYLMTRDLKQIPTTFYCGNIKKTQSRFFLYFLKPQTIKTFDDGSGNIAGTGYFYLDSEFRLLTYYAFVLLAPRCLYCNVRRNIHTNYSIFKLPNALPNTTYLPLFKEIASNRDELPSRTILLTNPFSEDGEMTLPEECELYAKIMAKYKVTHIIRHPRETQNKFVHSQIEELSIHLIAEELVYQQLKHYQLTVIGIYSTVLFNLLAFEKVKLINIAAHVKKPTKGLVDILQKSGVICEKIHI